MSWDDPPTHPAKNDQVDSEIQDMRSPSIFKEKVKPNWDQISKILFIHIGPIPPYHGLDLNDPRSS